MEGLFRAILIETRNVCNRQCWFCKFGQEREDEKILQMDWDTIHRILANLRDLDYAGRISWYNINEPLSDRRICEILKITREYCPRAFLSFATNGDLLNEDLYRRLKQSGLDALGVSIYDDETMAHVKPMADSRMVLMDMRRPQPGLLENRGGNIRQQEDGFRKLQSIYAGASCERPFTMMVVNPAGQVVLCCADMYWDVVLGDVREQRLEDIWSNELFARYRSTLEREGRRNLTLCRDCSYSGEGVKPYFPFEGNQPRFSVFDRIRGAARTLGSRRKKDTIGEI